MAVYVSIGEATGSLPLVKGCVWKSRGVCGTLNKYMDSLSQCWAVYGSLQEVYGSIGQSRGGYESLGESVCNKVTSNEVLGNLGESTVVQVRIWAVCQ